MGEQMKLIECIDWVSNVKREPRHDWPLSTLLLAPHKPFLLLTIIDLIEKDNIINGAVPPSYDLSNGFSEYWKKLNLSGEPAICWPMWHLQTDGHWKLIPKPGMEHKASKRPSTDDNLRRIFKEGKLTKSVFDYFVSPESRELLRYAIINSHFHPSVRSKIKND